jgi:methionyl-tRNA formyltransferase
MSVVRVCFLGTPDFAASHLQTLLNDSHYEVVGVVTQPDRPAGRKMQLTPSPVKTLALSKNIPVLTPENLRKEPEAFEIIKSWKAEVAVVVAFGQILSTEFLNSFIYGAVNVHGSLLPLWRGAAPIQRSVQAGDQVTGVALQKMVFKLDAGGVIGERRIALDEKITASELYSQLAVLGCQLLEVELMDYIRGNLAPIEQDETKVTIAPKILKEESLLSFEKPAKFLHNTVRGFNMGPGTYVMFQGKRLKIHETFYTAADSSVPPGFVSNISDEGLFIQTSSGQLILKTVQPESKNKMASSDFLKSVSVKRGEAFV